MQKTEEVKAFLSQNNIPLFIRITGGANLGRCYSATYFEVWRRYIDIKKEDWPSLYKFMPCGQEFYIRDSRKEDNYFVYSCEVRTDSSD